MKMKQRRETKQCSAFRGDLIGMCAALMLLAGQAGTAVGASTDPVAAVNSLPPASTVPSVQRDAFSDLAQTGSEWGVWIDNGLVRPGETVLITVSVPLATPAADLPKAIEVHPRYLEAPQTPVVSLPAEWRRSEEKKRWIAKAEYQPNEAGNYYAAIHFLGEELFSYFAAWKPGMMAVNFWAFYAPEYHATGNLKDLYLPQIRKGHLPVDCELALLGEKVFTENWAPKALFRRVQVETGAEVVPFLDGGYFHKLNPDLKARFEAVTETMPDDCRKMISEETMAVHGMKRLPDPTFHGLSVEQSTKVIEGAERFWKEWGFRPFSGVGTYSPGNALVEACRARGKTFISGVFPDYIFNDGGERWEPGWVQNHRGMPSFPYLISEVDFRRAGKADAQFTMMFPGWQNLPIWDGGLPWKFGRYGSDVGFFGYKYENGTSPTPADRIMMQVDAWERSNQLARNDFPLAMTLCMQMNNRYVPDVFEAIIARAARGNLIFVHKRYLPEYFKNHRIETSPQIAYTIPDGEIIKGVAKFAEKRYAFSDSVVWEGALGKAAFISEATEPLPTGRSIHLPVWWYDFRNAAPLGPEKNFPAVDLTQVTLLVQKEALGTKLIVQSPVAIDGLPICLWDLELCEEKSPEWIKKHRAVQVAAPKRMGQNATTWIIRPAINAGETVIVLK